MKYSHIYAPAAMVDYIDALNWYQGRSKRAAENFVLAVNDKVLDICKKTAAL